MKTWVSYFGISRPSLRHYVAEMMLSMTLNINDSPLQFVQKKDPNYKDVKEDTAWSMDKFNEYINENLMADKGLEENWAYNTLTVCHIITLYTALNSPSLIFAL